MKKKIGKFGFLKNGAGIGENAYQVRYGSLALFLKNLVVSGSSLHEFDVC